MIRPENLVRDWYLKICRDRDSLRLGNFTDLKTETHRDWKFYRCRDWDSSRLENFIDVETETYRDWEISWLSRLRPIETGQKLSRPRLYRESRWSLAPTEKKSSPIYCIIRFIFLPSLSLVSQVGSRDAKMSPRSYNELFLPSIADTKTTIFRILVRGDSHARPANNYVLPEISLRKGLKI